MTIFYYDFNFKYFQILLKNYLNKQKEYYKMEYYQYTILLFFGSIALGMIKDYIEVSYEHKKLKRS